MGIRGFFTKTDSNKNNGRRKGRGNGSKNIMDHYRRRPPEPDRPLDASLESLGDDPVAAVEGTLARQRLRAAIRRLTPDQQEALALRFGEGLTAREAARIMNKSTGAVEALQRRAVASLRRILAGEEL